MSRLRRMLPLGMLSRHSSLVWLLRDDFTTDASAPLASPRTAEPGPGIWTLTDSANALSISGGILMPAAATVSTRNPWLREVNGFARVAGRALIVSIKRVSSLGADDNTPGVGWHTTLSTPDTVSTIGCYHGAGGSAIAVTPATVVIRETYQNDVFLRVSVVLQSTGALIFIGDRLAWVILTGSENTLYPGIYSRGINTYPFALDYARIRDLPAPFNTDYGIATVNQATPVSGTSYTATADAITDLTLTAPTPLADEAGLRYRYTDDDNCWHPYLNSAGAVRLDSVNAGVATNRINVAAVIAAAGTVTMRPIYEDSLHDLYTLAGTTWTKRGGQVNVSHQNTATAIRPHAGTGWTLGALRSYPRTHAAYAELDRT